MMSADNYMSYKIKKSYLIINNPRHPRSNFNI